MIQQKNEQKDEQIIFWRKNLRRKQKYQEKKKYCRLL